MHYIEVVKVLCIILGSCFLYEVCQGVLYEYFNKIAPYMWFVGVSNRFYSTNI